MAPPFPLTNYQIGKIRNALDKVYDKIKYRVLGIGQGADFDIYSSLPGLYGAASMKERARPDEDVLKSLINIAAGYLDAQREITKTKTVQAIQAAITQARMTGHTPDFQKELKDTIKGIFRESVAEIRRILEAEGTSFKNHGALNGVIKTAAQNNVKDPVVLFKAPLDAKTCDYCVRLHFHNGGSAPRLWYLSELTGKYGKRGDMFPSLAPHPHCRAQLTILLPGFGLDGNGNEVWVESGHSEINKQRGIIEKSEKLPLIGTSSEFKEFSKLGHNGVFVNFNGSKTGLDMESLKKTVSNSVQEVCPSGAIFLNRKNFKIFVDNRLQADEVINKIKLKIMNDTD